MEKRKKRPGRIRGILLPILADILLIGVILCTFAMFHHVIPYIKAKLENEARLAAEATAPSETAPPAPSTPVETVVQETIEEVVDSRTPWQIQFEEHFSDEIVQTDHSYSSPQVSINIDTVVQENGSKTVVYHVADIYISSIENFKTHTVNGEYKYMATEDMLAMDAEVNALIAISGDFITYQSSGFLMRNGELYFSDYAYCDICVMYDDGRIVTYDKGTYVIEDILNDGALQVWNFGPALLDENGKAKQSFLMSTTVSYINPRSALGYYEPGHYCFVVVDGRQPGYSDGMTMPQLAQLFEDLGCTCAYNLDGGGSAVMSFNHEKYSSQSNGGNRKLGDILYICETEEAVE